MGKIADTGPTPVFILSFRRRDELASAAAAAGWRVVAARRREGAAARLVASGAPVAVVDARGALREALAATEALGGTVAAGGGALLVLVGPDEAAVLVDFYDAGATHFLAEPIAAGFAPALRFAARHAERMGGGWRPQTMEDPLGWRWQPGQWIALTPALVERVGSVRAALRAMAADERAELRAAIRQARARGAAAVAHGSSLGRVVQHLQRDGEGMAAVVEPLAALPAVESNSWAGDLVTTRDWLAQRLAGEGPVGAMLVALTRFDIVNAAYGRGAGDQLLRIAARRIEAVAATLGEATVARSGGAEFLLAAGADHDRMDAAAAEVARALALPFAIEGATALLGSRVAVTAREPGDDAALMLRRAREALAAARGADVAVVRASGPGEALAVDLHRALERGEIEVLFQPQVSLTNGRIVGAEALARWEHPRLGLLGAARLFAAAERADLGAALSDHVQALALARAAAWPAALAGLRLAVNVTAGDLARPDFARAFLRRVKASGFSVARLTAELTETGLMADLDAGAELLAELRAAGCRVAIDDFGTGYSSLAWLKALPLDYLKVDRALVQDIEGAARDRVVVRAVIEMARSLGLQTIVEGVETTAQRDLLAMEGADIYQGFLCAEPLDSLGLVRLVEGL